MQIKLKTGILNIKSNHSHFLQTLTGFGSRQSIYAQLADQIRNLLDDQPTMVIGLVEAAAGLGYGVYHHLGLSNAFYIHTTYHKLSQPVWLNFEEEHSHAPTHLLYELADSKLRDLRNQVKNVVLIDDEFSAITKAITTSGAFYWCCYFRLDTFSTAGHHLCQFA